MGRILKADDFDYDLPEELIARYPLEKRSASRLIVLNRTQHSIVHGMFKGFVDLAMPGDLVVFNNTKVIPARLMGRKITGGKIECLVERVVDSHHVLAHIRASKSPKVGSELVLADKISVRVVGREDDLFRLVFLTEDSVFDVLERYGQMPLPPYIDRQAESLDSVRYQTVFAERQGAVAAPTASLHFDTDIIEILSERGVEHDFVTLHVGAGTFQPVRVTSILDHVMHKEYLEVSSALCEKIRETKARGNRVIAVGTTVVRALETAAANGKLQAYQGDTQLFIYPGYQFQVVDVLLTNFHLPKSTLLMLVCAFAGQSFTLSAYQAAVAQKYRFFSYGDAMVVL